MNQCLEAFENGDACSAKKHLKDLRSLIKETNGKFVKTAKPPSDISNSPPYNSFRFGDRVRVQYLHNAVHLTGYSGIVRSYSPENDRFGVEVYSVGMEAEHL